MLKKSSLIFDIIGCMLGWSIVAFLWLLATINPVFAYSNQLLPISTITNAMLVATIIGAIGGYLAFGEDKKFPPSATSVGHVLLGLGAGLFFTRGSLELMVVTIQAKTWFCSLAFFGLSVDILFCVY